MAKQFNLSAVAKLYSHDVHWAVMYCVWGLIVQNLTTARVSMFPFWVSMALLAVDFVLSVTRDMYESREFRRKLRELESMIETPNPPPDLPERIRSFMEEHFSRRPR